MALRTHEYVECQEGKCRPLVLSEVGGLFVGLRGCTDDMLVHGLV